MRKNIYTRILTVIIGAAAVLSLAGCSSSDKELDPFDYIELGQYKGLDVEKQVHDVTEEEIQDEYRTLLEGYATEETLTEGTVQDGDTVNIDYCGKKDGTAFDGGTSNDYDLTIGSDTFIDGFEDGLIGAAIGDTVDIPLTFPENYSNTDLAGQDVVFTVTVNSVVRKTYPELTDELMKDISGGQYETVAAYREALEAQIVSEYDEMNELQYYEDLWNAAVDNAKVIKDIPADVINDNVSRLVVNSQNMAKSYGVDYETFLKQYMGVDSVEQFNSDAAEYAKQAAKETFVLHAIARTEGISVSEEELEEAIDNYVAGGVYASAEEFKQYEDLDALSDYILTSKVEDFLAENAKGAQQ